MPKCLAIDKKSGKLVTKKITVPVVEGTTFSHFYFLSDCGTCIEGNEDDFQFISILKENIEKD